jgi:hypothetical protein
VVLEAIGLARQPLALGGLPPERIVSWPSRGFSTAADTGERFSGSVFVSGARPGRRA